MKTFNLRVTGLHKENSIITTTYGELAIILEKLAETFKKFDNYSSTCDPKTTHKGEFQFKGPESLDIKWSIRLDQREIQARYKIRKKVKENEKLFPKTSDKPWEFL